MLGTTAIRDGLLLVDKPAGMTSHDVVAAARRSLGVRRIGHTGTLDPFATGLLVLLVGQATRLARFIDGEPKIYDATIVFGSETDTDDRTGNVVRVAELARPADVDAAIQTLTGAVHQTPPSYSAKKVAGQRAYAAARAGAPLALKPVAVTVHDWRIRSRSAASLDVTIRCSSGTYIRALARDLGRAAHSAAHLSALRRIASGVFDVRHAVTIDDVRAAAAPLVPMQSAVPALPSQSLDEEDVARVRHGQAVEARSDAPRVALIDERGKLVAIAERENDWVHPRVVLGDES
jgi:tRNA pseudouridine55 synthase